MKPKSAGVARNVGIAISLFSVAGLVTGLALVQSLGSDTLGRDVRDLHARISGLTRDSRQVVETRAP